MGFAKLNKPPPLSFKPPVSIKPPPQKCLKKISPPGGLIEDLRYLSKATAKKKKICSKNFQTKKKTYFDHPRDLEFGQSTFSPSPRPLYRVKILSSPAQCPN